MQRLQYSHTAAIICSDTKELMNLFRTVAISQGSLLIYRLVLASNPSERKGQYSTWLQNYLARCWWWSKEMEKNIHDTMLSWVSSWSDHIVVYMCQLKHHIPVPSWWINSMLVAMHQLACIVLGGYGCVSCLFFMACLVNWNKKDLSLCKYFFYWVGFLSVLVNFLIRYSKVHTIKMSQIKYS